MPFLDHWNSTVDKKYLKNRTTIRRIKWNKIHHFEDGAWVREENRLLRGNQFELAVWPESEANCKCFHLHASQRKYFLFWNLSSMSTKSAKKVGPVGRVWYFCYACRPCSWRHWHRLLSAKWQHSPPCLSRQTNVCFFNKQDEKWSEQLLCVHILFLSYRHGSWCFFGSVPL